MEENRMDAQAQNLEDFLQYFNQMEKYFEDMQDELLYLRGQLDELNDKTLKAKIDNFVKRPEIERTQRKYGWEL
mgnify:CR=1 FL=1